MKKLISVLVALCLLCAACAALADTEDAPTLLDMPAPVGVGDLDAQNAIEETAFEGEWILKYAFEGQVLLDDQTLAEKYDYNFNSTWTIIDGKLCQDEEDENGEFHTVEIPYVFENGELINEEGAEYNFCVDLLVDGNICLNFFIAGEGDEVINLALFLEKYQAE